MGEMTDEPWAELQALAKASGLGHAEIAKRLGLRTRHRTYVCNLLQGRESVSDDRLRNLAMIVGASAQRAEELVRMKRTSRRPLDLVDPAVPEVTDDEAAQFVGAMKALGFTKAKARAALQKADMPYYRAYRNAA